MSWRLLSLVLRSFWLLCQLSNVCSYTTQIVLHVLHFDVSKELLAFWDISFANGHAFCLLIVNSLPPSLNVLSVHLPSLNSRPITLIITKPVPIPGFFVEVGKTQNSVKNKTCEKTYWFSCRVTSYLAQRDRLGSVAKYAFFKRFNPIKAGRH